jgi:hypothetical protein
MRQNLEQNFVKYWFNHWFVLPEWISQSNITSKAKPEIWDGTRSPFWAKNINNSMFIEDLVTCRQWRHYNVILENSDIMLISG